MSTFYKTLLIFLAVVVYLKVKNWARWRYLRKWGETEGCGDVPTVPNILPWGLERFAILFTGLEGRDLLEDIVRPRFTEYGYTHRMHNVLRTIVATADPENIQAVLATKFQDFDLGPVRRKNFADVIGNGIFSSDGEPWIHYRSQLKPQFTRDQVSDLGAAERHLQIFYKAIPEDGATGWTEKVDLSPLLFRFTMDVSTEFLFGKSTNTQTRALSPDNSSSKDLKQDMDFAEAMTFAQEYIFYRSRFAGLYWLANSKKFQRACKTLKDFTADFVNVVLDPNNKRAAAGMGQKEKFILLDALVEETRDPTELRDQLLHVLLAGRDTTASLLSWIILLLSRYPTEFLKVRQAVLSQFGSTDIPTQEMTFTTLKQCKPIIHFLYETLRLYPLVPMNGRRAVRNTTLPTGGGRSGKQPIAIMKGEQVGFHSYALHRRHDIWGDDADEFKPERWEGRKLGWEYIPFSGGPRICLGQQYALNEASFVLAKLVQKYDKIEPIEPITDLAAPIKKRFTLVMFPADGVKVRLHKASD